jgi:hypothetical protein
MASANNKAALLEKYRDRWHFKDALEIIGPDPERREECEYRIATALWGIELAAKLDKPKAVRTPAQYSKHLETLARRLRADIKLAAKAIPLEYQIRRGKDSWIAEQLKRHLKETERAIDWNSKRVEKASPRLSYARVEAVNGAYLLLKKYSSKRLTLYRCHKLARVLLQNEQADLYKYLKPRIARLKPIAG